MIFVKEWMKVAVFWAGWQQLYDFPHIISDRYDYHSLDVHGAR